MIDDLAPVGTIADLFDPEPATWGLRGDPFVWRSMRTMLAKRVLPSTERDLVEILRSSFRWLAGSDLDDPSTDRIYREELARGGMTSGQVDLEVWRTILIPLLIERWRIVAPAAVVVAAAQGAQAAQAVQAPTSHSSR
jgi:hypothetical protein